jgi:cytochrome b
MQSSTASDAIGTTQQRMIQVWDPLVRVFHWTLVIAFTVAYLSGEGSLALHVWSGYAVGGLIVLRILWGFIGPQHARFADFAFGPLASLRYLGDLVRGRSRRYVGHSPAGAAMVFALLVTLVLLVGSGLQLYAVEDNAGPLAGLTTSAPGATTSAPAVGEDDDEAEAGAVGGTGGGEWWEEVHEVLANLVLALVILHIVGVVFASFIHHENLARAMVTGRKRPE